MVESLPTLKPRQAQFEMKFMQKWMYKERKRYLLKKAMGTAHDSLLYLDNFLGDNNRIGFGDFKFPKCLVVKLAVVLVTVPENSVVNTTCGMLIILI